MSWTDETDNLSLPPGNIHHGTAVVVDRSNVGWRFGARADLNDDGLTTAADWTVFRDNHLTDMSGLSQLETALLGDLDGDGDNDYYDFQLFKADYIAANGASAFAALLAVPEPNSLMLILIGLGAAAVVRGRAFRDRRSPQNRALSGG